MVALITPVDVEGTVKFNVTTESQPVEFTKVSMKLPEVFKLTPLNKYVSFEQMVALMTPVDVGRTVKFNVTTESQPVEFTNVSMKLPEVFKFTPLNK